MRKLSKTTLKTLENDPRMRFCSLGRYIPHICSPKIEWHHNLIVSGKQSDIPETIIAICSEIHKIADKKEIKEVLNWIMLNQMKEEDIQKISKSVNYPHLKVYLNKKYGKI